MRLHSSAWAKLKSVCCNRLCLCLILVFLAISLLVVIDNSGQHSIQLVILSVILPKV